MSDIDYRPTEQDQADLQRKVWELESQLSAARAEVERLKQHEHNSLCSGCVKFTSGLYTERDRYRAELENLVYSVAGTVGTKTNAELPEWFRLRLQDAEKVLESGGTK